MARPLQQEPDVAKIHVQVQELLRAAIRVHWRKPDELRISFSPEGYTRAQHQTVPGFRPFGGRLHAAETYLGLPFTVDKRQGVDVTLQLVDGSPIERGATR